MGYFDHLTPERPQLRAVPTTIDPERASRYATKALIAECENVAAAAEGTRNDTLNRAAFNLSQLVAAGHLAEDDVRSNLVGAAHAAGLLDSEIDATIASGFKAGSQQPRIVPELRNPPEITVIGDAQADSAVENVAELMLNPIIDWHDLFAAEDDGEEWIVEPLLPARRMVALYSAPKAGKSLLMLEIAVAISAGTEVIGTTLDRPRRVLYIDFENDPRGDVRARLEAMEVGPDQLANLCYLTFPSLAKFDTAQGAVDLLRHVSHYECEVVVIDTVSRAVMGEENANDTWLAFYRHTGLLLKQHGISCIRLDHSGKDLEKGMRGGSAKYGDVDAVWRLKAVGEDTINLECTDNRMPVPLKHLTLIRESYPLAHKVAGGEAWRAALDARAKEVDEALDRLGVPTSTSAREAGRALREDGFKCRKEHIEAAVRNRKMRLDLPSSEVSRGHLGDTRGHREEVSPESPPLRGTRGHLPQRPGDTPSEEPSPDPDELVSCKTCFRPTTAGIADTNEGRCATCSTTTEEDPR